MSGWQILGAITGIVKLIPTHNQYPIKSTGTLNAYDKKPVLTASQSEIVFGPCVVKGALIYPIVAHGNNTTNVHTICRVQIELAVPLNSCMRGIRILCGCVTNKSLRLRNNQQVAVRQVSK